MTPTLLGYKLRLLTTVAAAEVLCPHERHAVVLLGGAVVKDWEVLARSKVFDIEVDDRE